MDHFHYRDRLLFCEDVPVPELAEAYGTPLWVYSRATLLHHLGELQRAFAAADPLLCFSIKTNPVSFGQAPVFLPDGRVLFGQDYKQGAKNQVYIENFDGTGQQCLTCADVPVCVNSAGCVMTGVGEALEPLSLPKMPCVMVNPGVPVATT